MKLNYLLVFVAIVWLSLVIVWIGGDDQPTKVVETVKIGEMGIVNNNQDKTNCQGTARFAVSSEALHKSVEAQVENDRQGFLLLVGEGQIYYLDNCTEVLKIGGSVGVAEVRIISSGEVAFIESDYLKVK